MRSGSSQSHIGVSAAPRVHKVSRTDIYGWIGGWIKIDLFAHSSKKEAKKGIKYLILTTRIGEIESGIKAIIP